MYCINSSNLGGALIPRRAAPRRCHATEPYLCGLSPAPLHSTPRAARTSYRICKRRGRRDTYSIDRSIDRKAVAVGGMVDGIWRTILAQFLCSTIHAELQTWCCLGWGASLVLAHFTMITKANKNTKLLNCIGVNKTVIRVRPTDRIFFF